MSWIVQCSGGHYGAAMTIIFKICDRADWADAERAGIYQGSPDDKRDGFIHLSTRDQLRGTLDRHFKGMQGLVLIAFDTGKLANLIWEPSRGGALFPHVYGTLEVSKALWVKDLPQSGELPVELAA